MSTLHITNGDRAADALRLIVEGPVTIMADVLHEGPCPQVEGDAWYDVRARFLHGGATHDDVKTTLAGWDRTIVEACQRRNEIVLWFEHDLFDQLALIRTLDLMSGGSVGPALHQPAVVGRVLSDPAHQPRVSLICIDRFPGIDRFVGLGQLTAGQMATLIGTGVPVADRHHTLASAAWHAFRSPDPSELLAVTARLCAARTPASDSGPALPFLGDALRRFLAEFPSVANGLSQTEELALAALRAGPLTARRLFRATQTKEARPFMGDTVFYQVLSGLAASRIPLVTVDAGSAGVDLGRRRIAITDAGLDVLAGRADRVRLNGIDLWRGGVHLRGSDHTPWRWDARRETLVS